MCLQSWSISMRSSQKQQVIYFQQLAVFLNSVFSPQESSAACAPRGRLCSPMRRCVRAAPSSEACTRLPVFTELIPLKLSSFSVHLSVKFTSVAGKQQLASPQTSAGSRHVCTSCRGARLTTTVIGSVVESERRLRESCLKTPREHKSLRNPVLNKNLWAFLLHASLFLTDYLRTRTQNRD